MALPSVQKVKLEAMRAKSAAAPEPAVATKPTGPTAVVSMAPHAPAPVVEAPIDEASFAVDDAAAAAPVPAPVVQEPARVVEGDTDFQAQSKEFYHKWKTVAGMYEKAKSDLEEQKEALSALTAEVSQLKAAKPQVVRAPDEEISEAEEATYKDAFPVVRKLGRKVAREVMDEVIAPLQEEIRQLREGTATTEKKFKQSEEQTFYQSVKARVPEMDAFLETPEWQEYQNQRVPYTNYTLGQALISAHTARDLDRVTEILHGFKKPVPVTLESLVTPHVQSTGSSQVNSAPKPKLKWSERQKASLDFRKGRINKQRFDEIAQLYKRAESENRVDMSA